MHMHKSRSRSKCTEYPVCCSERVEVYAVLFLNQCVKLVLCQKE